MMIHVKHCIVLHLNILDIVFLIAIHVQRQGVQNVTVVTHQSVEYVQNVLVQYLIVHHVQEQHIHVQHVIRDIHDIVQQVVKHVHQQLLTVPLVLLQLIHVQHVNLDIHEQVQLRVQHVVLLFQVVLPVQQQHGLVQNVILVTH